MISSLKHIYISTKEEKEHEERDVQSIEKSVNTVLTHFRRGESDWEKHVWIDNNSEFCKINERQKVRGWRYSKEAKKVK